MQKRGILRDHADIGTQAVLGDVLDILPIDQYAPLLDVIKPQQQIDERGLARPRPPNQPDFLARPDMERKMIDDRASSHRNRTVRPRSGYPPCGSEEVLRRATSVTTCGRDSVSIPSRTVPTCSNNDAISHITQWDMPLSRSDIAPAAATAPTPIAFSVHNISATPVVLMIRMRSHRLIDDFKAGHQSHLLVYGL